ncbi:MAG: bifunctional 4-hydroxy-3-methylbut-2-enyl diphosphate reductase/30S ribosomal protein S1 [Clostridia bacterium]|nr:bifunctional 4-hydroxy-3-methylbut-2-enyl diphosphate reductase/30S ribosomal protein S1 [Clostridia bacterium]
MNIILAKHAGFCFGVRRAVEITKQTAKKVGGESGVGFAPRVFTYGELIHNRTVVDELAACGITAIDSPSEAREGDYVVIRSHGVPKSVFDELTERGLNVIDATCPFVARIHETVSAAKARGERVFIVGEMTHPEVVGINGHCGDSAVFIRGEDELSKLAGGGGCLVVQTTFDYDTFSKMRETIERDYPEITVNNTICTTTRERQKEADELSHKCDVMLVLGDKNSSNTQKLKEICKKNCNMTQNAAKVSDISLDLLKNCDIMIGVVAGASTPDSIIREVINTMNEQVANTEATTETVPATAAQTIDENAVFDEDAINKTIVRIHGGQILTGTVIQIVDGEISVSIGYKSDGYIPRSEFSDDPEVDPASVFKVGDPIEVEVLKVNDGEGNVLLSRKNVERQKVWDEFSNDPNVEDKVFEGVCTEVIKGGVIVELNNGAAKAFVPASQVSTRFVQDLKQFVGQPMKLKILEVDEKRRRVVASCKAILQQEADEAEKKIWDNLEVGMKTKGIVRRMTDFGAFVDIGGVDGLVHITQCAWGRVKNPAEVFAAGQEIDVVIRELDRENKKISLGYRELLPKPWSTADERYPVGSFVEGKVVRIVTFGAFVSLEPTIDGLIHISQVGLKRVSKVEDEINVGDRVRCKVIEVDTAKRRISLSRRDALIDENPEEAAAIIAREREQRDRERQERQEKRAQDEQTRRENQAAREERRRERDEQRPRRRREDADYELPPVESATTSLAALLGGLVSAEEETAEPAKKPARKSKEAVETAVEAATEAVETATETAVEAATEAVETATETVETAAEPVVEAVEEAVEAVETAEGGEN